MLLLYLSKYMKIELCPGLIKSLKFAAHFMDARGEAVETSPYYKIGPKMRKIVFIYDFWRLKNP